MLLKYIVIKNMNTLTIKAYAKINLAINVLGKLENGYHDIDMVTVPLFLHDTLEITKLGAKYNTYLFSNDEKIPCDETNLVYKALFALKASHKFTDNFKIYIYKRIPVEAGLGGGSSDAASIIKELPALLADKINDTYDPYLLAKQIGSDVSFFIKNKPARVRKVGEELEEIEIKCPYHVLLVKPSTGLSTKEVYSIYDDMKDNIIHPNIDELISALKIDDEDKIQANLVNVLTKPAISKLPIISDILSQLNNMNLPLSGMSGTGSTCFALSKDKKYLKDVASYFEKQEYQVFLTQLNLTQK